jgi:hypothetical protein
MLTDIFLKRYPPPLYLPHGVPAELTAFFSQAAQIVFGDLRPYIDDIHETCAGVYQKVTREVPGCLKPGDYYDEIIWQCLTEPFDVYDDRHGTAEVYVKVRLSVIELLFREIDEQFASGRRSGSAALMARLSKRTSRGESEERKVFRTATQELNHRLREAHIPFHYHNGFLQSAADDITMSQIAEPFWDVISAPKWKNVDIDIKEAIDRRDSGGRDVAFYALKALESVIKIISDEKGWTRDAERGAANYIDNLVSTTNGRFIDPWEANALKILFRDLRNPEGHGPGSRPQPSLTNEQQSWAIESCMSWIKSLVHRL